MDSEKKKRLKQIVNYTNEEQLLGEDKQLMYFENLDEFIEALRGNRIPGVRWTEECEAKWQAEQKLESIYLDKGSNYEDYDDPWGAQL